MRRDEFTRRAVCVKIVPLTFHRGKVTANTLKIALKSLRDSLGLVVSDTAEDVDLVCMHDGCRLIASNISPLT